MPDCSSEVADVIGLAPADLAAYYGEGVFPKYPDSRINCLHFDGARDYSRKMQGIPVVDRLGLWVLDDANDSNPYAYISKGPCAGMIIHFSHDPVTMAEQLAVDQHPQVARVGKTAVAAAIRQKHNV